MSQQDLGRFLEFIAGNEGTAAALVAAVDGRQGDAACDAVSSFARGHGYDVDGADARLMQQALMQSRDLRDDELEGVEGGAEIRDPVVTAVTLMVGGVGSLIANAVEGRAWNSPDNAFMQFMRSW